MPATGGGLYIRIYNARHGAPHREHPGAALKVLLRPREGCTMMYL